MLFIKLSRTVPSFIIMTHLSDLRTKMNCISKQKNSTNLLMLTLQGDRKYVSSHPQNDVKKPMSIILTHTYFLFEDEKEQSIMRPYAPLGLLYISAYLNENKVENHLYDTTFYSKADQLRFIEEKQPKVIAIYTNLMTKINVIELVKILKTDEMYGFPKIILGGPDITYKPEFD